MSMYQTHILKNGLKVIHQQVDGKAAWCGLIIGVGSRDERPEEEGIAHFIEHVIFKGTEKRKAFHILSRIEDVGGELNAYTTKEDTCIYASFLARDYERALELFADIVFHSVFPEKEIEKEKEVVIDEINSYKDSPGELIFDDFEDMIFVGSSLGHNILGCKSALMKYTRDDLLRFVARTYNTDQMVFSVIGNVSAKRFKDTCDRYFGGMGESLRGFTRDAVVPVASFSKELHRKCYQAHCILGGRAYNLNDERRVVLSLLTNLLGGPSANSLLNLAVRERNGLAYNIEAGFTPFSDTGLATIYFGTDKERADECLELIDLELTKIRSGKLSDRLLHIAKKQYLGQITIAMENNESYMLSAARSFLVYNNIDAMETIREKIGTVTRDEIVAVANEIYGTQNLSMLMYR